MNDNGLLDKLRSLGSPIDKGDYFGQWTATPKELTFVRLAGQWQEIRVDATTRPISNDELVELIKAHTEAFNGDVCTSISRVPVTLTGMGFSSFPLILSFVVREVDNHVTVNLLASYETYVPVATDLNMFTLPIRE